MDENRRTETPWDVYKRIRTQLGKYLAEEVIVRCIRALNRKDAADLQRVRHYPPFLILLLVKWSLAHGQYWQAKAGRLTDDAFVGLVNLMHDLHGTALPQAKSGNLFLYLRKMAFQQFYLQQSANPASLARQSLLFACLPPDHYIARRFQELTGLTISEFLELGLALVTKFLTHPSPLVDAEWFQSVGHAYSPGTIQRFLSALALDLPAARVLMTRHTRAHSIQYQVFEQTPLSRHPLLEFNNKYACYYPQLLYHALQAFVYDTVRQADPSAFMDRFGRVFEDYVRRHIDYTRSQYLDERELRKLLGPACKAVDFLVTTPEGNVYIDAKGTEMGYLGMVSEDPELIVDKTRVSVLKAIEQAFDAARQISMVKTGIRLHTHPSSSYLIVVTYRELYVGTGRDFYESAAANQIDKVIAAHGNTVWIPLEHIYCVSIDDFEALCQYCVTQDRSIVTALSEVVERDACPSTKALGFGQHLREVNASAPAPFMEQEFDRLVEAVRDKIRASPPSP